MTHNSSANTSGHQNTAVILGHPPLYILSSNCQMPPEMGEGKCAAVKGGRCSGSADLVAMQIHRLASGRQRWEGRAWCNHGQRRKPRQPKSVDAKGAMRDGSQRVHVRANMQRPLIRHIAAQSGHPPINQLAKHKRGKPRQIKPVPTQARLNLVPTHL